RTRSHDCDCAIGLAKRTGSIFFVRSIFFVPPVQMIDLNTVLSPSSGWTLLSATGINNAGQITGSGDLMDRPKHTF
ncbi:MAG TPA: hypothetical protein VG269_02135, partial [Tepidisphaeraceae bacterium]|nr:hypothetical protein [Tepidisphaeraceae bacterium]